MDWIKVIEWIAGILGSLIVVYCTQLINDRLFVPKNTLKALLQEIDATISYYANVISNPGVVNKELEMEASNKLREMAMKYMAFIATNPKIKERKITHEELDSIGPELIRFSNTVSDPLMGEKNADKDELNELFEEQASVLHESHQRTERFIDTIITVLFILLVILGISLLYYVLVHKTEERHIRYLQYINDRKSDQLRRMKEKTNEWMSENNQRLQELAASPEMATMRKRCANRELPSADEWEEFQTMMDALYSSFVQQLVSVFHLSTQEIHVCLLVKAQFKPMEIAILTAHSKEAISSTRRRLYKKITGKSGTPEQLDKLIMEW